MNVMNFLRSFDLRPFLGMTCLVLAACGGSGDAPPPPVAGASGPPPAVAPAITQQPADLSVATGQPASFTVAASGTAPLTYQWQRNGADIAGATTTTYSLAATVLTDSGATFRAVVTNVAGSATSVAATLTVTSAAPVLTVTPQPADTSVAAGTSASFTVGGNCSSGTLAIQWQRSPAGAPVWAAIAGATAATYSFATVIGDTGAQFRALLDCSGQSGVASNVATLTVTAPASVTLGLLPLTGLRDQADISSLAAIDQDAADSFTFITANRIKRLSTDLASITPVAGGQFGGSADGVGANASFSQPLGLAHDAAGNVIVADSGNNTIRRIAPDGTVTTLAGQAGTSGSTDGTGAAARFNSPRGIALGPDGDLYVADSNNHLIRRITTAGVVTTDAGSVVGFFDGAPLAAKFNSPYAVAVAANGDVLVADYSNARVRRIVRSGNAAGAVETLAGNGTIGTGQASSTPDGIGAAAVIAGPSGMVVRGNTLTLRDSVGQLRQIDLTTRAVTTFTGSRPLGEGRADGPATSARLDGLGVGVTGAPGGGFMLTDQRMVRSVSATGTVRTIASRSAAGITPTGIGTLPQMPFGLGTFIAQGLAVDGAGNVVVADSVTQTVRRIAPSGVVTLVAGLPGGLGNAQPSGFPLGGPVDGIANEAQILGIGYAMTINAAGVIYLADGSGLRAIATNNAVTTPAGSVTDVVTPVDGPGPAARFNRIFGLAAKPGGDLFIGDPGSAAVRRLDALNNVSTFAGVLGQSQLVNGPLAASRFINPGRMAFAPDGTLYVVDAGTPAGGGLLRKISADGTTVSTVAAAGSFVGALTVDAAGTLYYAEYNNGGLYMLPAGAAAATVVIPPGNGVLLGAAPRIKIIDQIAVLGPKQLVLSSEAQLLVVTLP